MNIFLQVLQRKADFLSSPPSSPDYMKVEYSRLKFIFEQPAGKPETSRSHEILRSEARAGSPLPKHRTLTRMPDVGSLPSVRPPLTRKQAIEYPDAEPRRTLPRGLALDESSEMLSTGQLSQTDGETCVSAPEERTHKTDTEGEGKKQKKKKKKRRDSKELIMEQLHLKPKSSSKSPGRKSEERASLSVEEKLKLSPGTKRVSGMECWKSTKEGSDSGGEETKCTPVASQRVQDQTSTPKTIEHAEAKPKGKTPREVKRRSGSKELHSPIKEKDEPKGGSQISSKDSHELKQGKVEEKPARKESKIMQLAQRFGMRHQDSSPRPERKSPLVKVRDWSNRGQVGKTTVHPHLADLP